MSFAKGKGRFQVGDVVRYTGKPKVFHTGQEEVKPGDTGRIVWDFGFDYRYLILLDRPVGRRMVHSGVNVEFDIRTGVSSWEIIKTGGN